MASASELLKLAQKFTIDNSPLILTGIGAAGVVSTAVLSVRAGFKAARLIDSHESVLRAKREAYHETPHLTPKEKFKLTWTCYIPPAGAALLSCGAVIGANQIGTKRAAALAAAYTLSEKAFDEYREAVVQRFGEKKEKDARDDAAQSGVNKTPLGDREIIIMAGEFICFDTWSGRYFKNTVEGIKYAVNKINAQIIADSYASLSDFYYEIGLAPTKESEQVGWNVDKLLDVHITTVLTDKGEPAISLEYRVVPIVNYFRLS